MSRTVCRCQTIDVNYLLFGFGRIVRILRIAASDCSIKNPNRSHSQWELSRSFSFCSFRKYIFRPCIFIFNGPKAFSTPTYVCAYPCWMFTIFNTHSSSSWHRSYFLIHAIHLFRCVTVFPKFEWNLTIFLSINNENSIQQSFTFNKNFFFNYAQFFLHGSKKKTYKFFYTVFSLYKNEKLWVIMEQ